jgi:hypothetical protein
VILLFLKSTAHFSKNNGGKTGLFDRYKVDKQRGLTLYDVVQLRFRLGAIDERGCLDLKHDPVVTVCLALLDHQQFRIFRPLLHLGRENPGYLGKRSAGAFQHQHRPNDRPVFQRLITRNDLDRIWFEQEGRLQYTPYNFRKRTAFIIKDAE